ncbi:MAG: hypothetical protein QM582_02835 [Micropruina sp.]|uniref:hypothetical protein n=1 Tax=Micropruina sp. TaxID=2737536 RepID=UPI0039E3A703
MAMTAAWVAAGLLGALAIVQLCLAAGAPWGRFAWGGRHPGVLPARWRIASACAPLLYAAIAAVLLCRAGVLGSGGAAWAHPAAWAVFGYFVLSAAANLASRSPAERWTMGPSCLVLALAALVVAGVG